MLGGRVVRAVIAAAVAAAIGLAAWHASPIERLELNLVDARYDVRGGHPTPDVVVVGIDEDTLTTFGTWPFNRRLHARAIDALRAAGAKRIAYDVQFARRTPADKRLIQAADHPDVILGAQELFEDGTPQVIAAKRFGGRIGYAGFPVDADGAMRTFRGTEFGLPTLDALAAGRGADEPLRPIDFAGPTGSVPEISVADVLNGSFDPAAVRGKVVVVGATAPILQDLHPTAVGDLMAGPEIHANAIQTILDGFPLRDAPTWVGVLMILACAAVAPAAALSGRLWPPLAAGAGAIAVLFVGAQVAFDSGTIVAVAAPLLTIAVGTLGAVALTYATEVRARRRVRLAFERFVPPAVIDEVVKRDEMAPKRVQATMLFCDLRGFTTLGEQLDAERVIAALNRYLEMVSGAVFDHGGTVVSYQGDGVLAVFGAPLEQPDHAHRAVATARQVLEDGLPAYNRWLADSGLSTQPLSAGIGVNSGPVMAGSVGSSKRLEYAAVGDTTNVAARLQALGRDHDARMFVAATTYEQLPPEDRQALRELGPVELKGRHEPVTVYAQ
jgi:adenylate cyclase